MSRELEAQIARLAFAEHDAPVVSIIVHGSGDLAGTLRTLRSIHNCPPQAAIELIIADHALPQDDSVALQRIPGLRPLGDSTGSGFVESCNRAVASARGRYVHLLGCGAEVTSGWLDALIAVIERFPSCAAVGSHVVSADGLLLHAGGVVWNDGSRIGYGRGQSREAPELSYVREVDYCSGVSMLLRADAVRDHGVFDPRYPAADYTDVDLAFRLRERGFAVRNAPRSIVVHQEKIPFRSDLASEDPATAVRGQAIFFERWRHVLAHRHYAPTKCLFRAREHAMHKRILLVVDHYLPQPDRDAGSRAIMQTMQQLLAMGYVVKFWPENQRYDPDYRHLLEDAGIEIIVGDRWSGRFERFARYAGPELDTVLLSRPMVAADVVDVLRRVSDARLVLYGHDLHFRRMFAQAEVTGDQTERAAAAQMRLAELGVWHAMDAVIYPSREEADLVADLAGVHKVHAVPLYAFAEDEFIAARADRTGERLLFVAGFGHSPNVDAAQWLVRQVWPELRKQLPQATLDLVGSNPTKEVLALSGEPGIQVSGTVSTEVLEGYYREAAVAIVPLRFGAGVKLKVLEAMSRGVPVVTTTVGAQGLPGVERCIGVADDVEGVVTAVVALIRDRELALRRSIAAQAYVRQHYSDGHMRQALTRAMATV